MTSPSDNWIRMLQSQCTGPTAPVPPAAPKPPLLHVCPTGKHMSPCSTHSSSSGKFTYSWVNSQFWIINTAHVWPFYIVFYSDVKPWKKLPPKGKACSIVAPNWHFFSYCLYISVWAGVTSRELYFSLCFVCCTLASARPAMTTVTPWIPSKQKY